MNESYKQSKLIYVRTSHPELGNAPYFDVGIEITTELYGLGAIINNPLCYCFDHIGGKRTYYRTVGISAIETKGKVERVLPKNSVFWLH
ncbi:hypothetical protein A2767_06155 [Candidatus Roizmanbacteria bacterium RIFCSPHIGHO2_01_FULL_35_10]|uniref:Uncharacterized protein n=1 Tax=Candidatus Roizmanbacteria bacterium RIFCSPLOWO2_01_FULL_35_13 TaxID=1802055 RepID=A0A1F7I988_9BACT|nr:MAG: hypothetical protein A2767_06155 [Candidatus Roizmanbacteria bacterium RIFCSPHIGHO2_01_FULL_35_10]OGK39938.1 MAG: hypothetical protein A3A74_07875 [Candidatus Roizmanbacteria bacterium RIFCSPLOWO2_01_FULL_35_13]